MDFVKWSDVPATKETPGPVNIYALVDPRDETVRYVGVTSNGLDERLAQHVAHPTNLHMRAWLSELKRAELQPIVRLLMVPRGHWANVEIGWIEWFRQRGDLLNIDPGGRARSRGKLRRWAAKANERAFKRRERREAFKAAVATGSVRRLSREEIQRIEATPPRLIRK